PVQVIGPFGAIFLMPNDPSAHLIMICTGTGSAPMRAMTERRRRLLGRGVSDGGDPHLMLFFGARTQAELPYFGPLTSLPRNFIDTNLVFSRTPGQPKRYVQDLLRDRGSDVARVLAIEQTHVYVCGLKGMEEGVWLALADICRQYGLDWSTLHPRMCEQGRYHVETY
ncbi:MAG: benzoyl-CoA oxygenase, partial [Betaproteobacteria bacterium]|nr:benzoyl-CoA oxygenase [Betaproteobacteria bacterium]